MAFWTLILPNLAPTWPPLGLQHPSKTGLKTMLKLNFLKSWFLQPLQCKMIVFASPRGAQNDRLFAPCEEPPKMVSFLTHAKSPPKRSAMPFCSMWRTTQNGRQWAVLQVVDAKASSKGQSMEHDCDVEKLKIQSSCKGSCFYKRVVSKRSRSIFYIKISFKCYIFY